MNGARRAVRVHPSAVGILFGYRVAAALAISYPAARALFAFGPISAPAGDRILFEPGGYHLLEALRLGGPVLSSSAEVAALGLSAAGVLGLVPLGLATVTLISPGAPLAERTARTVSVLPRLLFLGGGTLLARAVLVFAASVAVGAAAVLGDRAADERAPTVAAALVALPFGALWVLLGVIQDLARAAVVRLDTDVSLALGRALGALRAQALRLGGWLAAMGGAGVAAVAAAALLVDLVDVSRPGEGRVWAVLLVHQVTAALLVTLRVKWLAVTLDAHAAPLAPLDTHAAPLAPLDTHAAPLAPPGDRDAEG